MVLNLAARINTVLPYFNFVVAGGALLFQTTVLYPWHVELEREFAQFKHDQHDRMEAFSQRTEGEKLSHIEERLASLAHKESIIRHHVVKPNMGPHVLQA